MLFGRGGEGREAWGGDGEGMNGEEELNGFVFIPLKFCYEWRFVWWRDAMLFASGDGNFSELHGIVYTNLFSIQTHSI